MNAREKDIRGAHAQQAQKAPQAQDPAEKAPKPKAYPFDTTRKYGSNKIVVKFAGVSYPPGFINPSQGVEAMKAQLHEAFEGDFPVVPIDLDDATIEGTRKQHGNARAYELIADKIANYDAEQARSKQSLLDIARMTGA